MEGEGLLAMLSNMQGANNAGYNDMLSNLMAGQGGTGSAGSSPGGFMSMFGGQQGGGGKIDSGQLGALLYAIGRDLWKMGSPQTRAGISDSNPLTTSAAARGTANTLNKAGQQQPTGLANPTSIQPLVNAASNPSNPLTQFTITRPDGGTFTGKGTYDPNLGTAMATGGQPNPNFPGALQLP